MDSKRRRAYGLHLTSIDIFNKYIFPEIKHKLLNYLWIDLYAGEGNLILPILEKIKKEERIKFFETHIFLSDSQEEMVKKCIRAAERYGIPEQIAVKRILLRDNLKNFPQFLIRAEFPIFHITNPPYLYLGYIRKHTDTQKYLKLFKDKNKGYQDLYQIAMINDFRNEIENLIYIIPSNFLFGASISNKFRMDFLKKYKILKMIIFETKIFEFTGTNICIGFFKKKEIPKVEDVKFSGIKIKKQTQIITKDYHLKPKYKYRSGFEFDEFLEKFKVEYPLKIKFYLMNEEVLKKKGNFEILVIDANQYRNNEYKKLTLKVNEELKKEVESNILYVRTVDTGSYEGRVGLNLVQDDFGVQGIYVSSNTYRTHPIQIFFGDQISLNDQLLLKSYFNFVLEHFREKLDSEFLTTYKYSNAIYTRKYLGLTQTRKLIETFPYRKLESKIRKKLNLFIHNKDFNNLISLLNTCKNESN
ncbi:MAG: SAM-dependent DNA methyltransferase [Candidatus Thorarchaeota archaeon]